MAHSRPILDSDKVSLPHNQNHSNTNKVAAQWNIYFMNVSETQIMFFSVDLCQGTGHALQWVFFRLKCSFHGKSVSHYLFQ